MITNSYSADPISPEESTRHSWGEEENRVAREHDLAVRRLELEVLKTQNRWESLFKIPVTIIKLPVYTVMALGYVVAMIRKHDPPESFWSLLK